MRNIPTIDDQHLAPPVALGVKVSLLLGPILMLGVLFQTVISGGGLKSERKIAMIVVPMRMPSPKRKN